ncbi:MAG: AtpZ/AtpI family protein [Pseudomonadota bacterium]
MADDHDTPSDPPSLDAFAKRLEEARASRRSASKGVCGGDGGAPSSGSGMGVGFKIATELVAALFVGVGLGFGFDTFAGTSPLGVLIGFGIGMAAGFLNVRRGMTQMSDEAQDGAAQDDSEAGPPAGRGEA